ncbi:hypothetical protein SBA3_1760008 [Candidatus Sulfopaludibacter sp. SbA3]|nr:hypothetical protein SBA3_1760008 [Candidatus Sulfopaludibacter sp. SbA3]
MNQGRGLKCVPMRLVTPPAALADRRQDRRRYLRWAGSAGDLVCPKGTDCQWGEDSLEQLMGS